MSLLRSQSSSVVSSIGALEAMPGVRDDDVDAAEGERRLAVGVDDRRLVGDVGHDCDRGVAEFGGVLGGTFAVDVGDDDAGALGDERPGDGAADAAGAAGDQGDRSLELPRRRRERQLVQLERPVLDPERLLVVERDEAAERGGAAHDCDRAVVEVAGEPGGLQRPPGADEADALDQHDPRARVEELVTLGPIPLEVGALALVEVADLLDQALPEGGRIVAIRVELDPGRTPLRVHEVVGAGRADLRELARLAPADELEHRRRAVDLEDPRAVDPRPRRAAPGAPRQAAQAVVRRRWDRDAAPRIPRRRFGALRRTRRRG